MAVQDGRRKGPTWENKASDQRWAENNRAHRNYLSKRGSARGFVSKQATTSDLWDLKARIKKALDDRAAEREIVAFLSGKDGDEPEGSEGREVPKEKVIHGSLYVFSRSVEIVNPSGEPYSAFLACRYDEGDWAPPELRFILEVWDRDVEKERLPFPYARLQDCRVDSRVIEAFDDVNASSYGRAFADGLEPFERQIIQQQMDKLGDLFARAAEQWEARKKAHDMPRKIAEKTE